MEKLLKHRIRKVIGQLREPSNWLKQPRGEEWKDVVNVYDRLPFEAADLLEAMIKEPT